jgi:TRAP-type C4-dicarboxylate transport system substrate-binding protein
MVQDAIDVAFEHILEYQKGLTETSLDKILEAKPEMTVTRLTDAQRAPFQEAAASVEAAFIDMTGDSGQTLLDQMKSDLEAVAD